ncbi:MAG: O-antigen ligase family protein [Thermodesulfobacteriota bacterium]|nr:O-antigen ligase family protein [Thermodesulfobacteriota bacterium]
MKETRERILLPVDSYWVIFVALFILTVTLGSILAYSYKTALLGIVFLFFSTAVFIRPIIGLYFILFFLPLMNVGFAYENPNRTNDEFISIAAVPIVVTFVAHLIDRVLYRKNKIYTIRHGSYRYAQFLLFFLILGFSLISLLWSIDCIHGLNNIFVLILGFILIILFTGDILTKDHIYYIIKALPFLGLFLSFLLLLSDFYYDFASTVKLSDHFDFVLILHANAVEGKVRPGGFAPVDLASNILTIFVFSNIALAYIYGWRGKIFLLLHSFLLIICILKTASKAGALSLAFGLFLLPIIIPELRNRVIRLTTLGIFAIGLVLIFFGKVILMRFGVMISGKAGFLTDRLYWWSQGFEHLYKTGGIGLGAGGFTRIIDPVPAAHSFYFSVLFDLGILGFVLFMTLLALIIRKIIVSLSQIPQDEMRFLLYCLSIALITLFLHGFVDFDYSYLPFWALVGSMLGIIRIYKTKKKASIPV